VNDLVYLKLILTLGFLTLTIVIILVSIIVCDLYPVYRYNQAYKFGVGLLI